MFTLILTILLASSIATDSMQTINWIDGTKENPITLSDGTMINEANSFLAGRLQLRESYFLTMERLARTAQHTLDPPASRLIAGARLVNQG